MFFGVYIKWVGVYIKIIIKERGFSNYVKVLIIIVRSKIYGCF